MEDYWLILLLIGIFSVLILSVCIWIDYVNRKSKMTDEEYKEYKNNKKIERKKQQAEAEKLYRQKKTIKSVAIIGSSSDSRKSATSSIARGAVGGAILGPAGLVGGALSGKNKVSNQTTFLIEYYDGHRESKTVENNSSEFNKLIKYIKM